MTNCTKPLVVAAPRSGFSLLISIINALAFAGGEPSTIRGTLLKRLVELTSFYITNKYKETFARFGVVNDLVFNGEFHLLVGGPKWLDPAKPERACFRKYFGIRGMGDFLLVTSHPREVMEYYAVLHSHSAPALWLNEPYYERCRKLTSIRNPIGIVNSASFSLNAMASEHIQRFQPNDSEDLLRQRIGLYKLTDIEVVRGLILFLKNYLDQYLPTKNGYFVMRWENLIENPVKTIMSVAAALDVACDESKAEAIWRPMDHVNLLEHHKHNYRTGKGIVGDWKNSLVNEHMHLFREYDFDLYMEALGYPPIPDLDRSLYSPYQRLVERYIRRGEVYRNTGDADLFGYAFNKSNIDASAFGFKSFPKRDWTHVERSTLRRDDIVEAVSDVAEESCEKINRIFAKVLGADLTQAAAAHDVARSIRDDCLDLMLEIDDVRGVGYCDKAFGVQESIV